MVASIRVYILNNESCILYPQLNCKLKVIKMFDIIFPLSTYYHIPNDIIVSYNEANLSITGHTGLVKFFSNQHYPFNEMDVFDQKAFDDIEKDALNCYAHWVHLKNVYVYNTFSFLTENFSFVDIENVQILKQFRSVQPAPLISEYSSVIGFGHLNVFIYGHWIDDVLSPLTLFPEDIIKNSYFLVNTNKYWRETLPIFGINQDQVICLKEPSYIYASNFFTVVDPLPHMAHFGGCMKKVIMKMKIYYNLIDAIPEYYYISNREKTRSLTNIFEIVKAAQETYPEYNIMYVTDPYNLNDAAKLWSSARFIFMPTGSNFYKEMFMQKGAVACVGLGDAMDYSLGFIAVLTEIHLLYFRIPGMRHHVGTVYYCDVNVTIAAFKPALYCAKYGHWNENDVFEYNK